MKTNKKGSVTIFVCVFFLTLVMLIFAFIGAGKRTAVSSSADALCGLWADSILAEYDLNLRTRYNLFGFYGYPKDVRDKIDFYAEKSFAEKRYIHYGGSSCSLYEYSLVCSSIFKAQVLKAGKLAFTEKFIAPTPEVKSVISASHQEPIDASKIFQDLPSEGNEKSFSVSGAVKGLNQLDSVKDMIETESDGYFINKYISAYFNCLTEDRFTGKTWLLGEREYIICGKKSDEENKSSIRRKIVSVREGMNLLYLHSNPKKRREAMVAAEILTPGPEAAATCEAILAAWALAESYNDYALLISGYKVPLKKSEASWAVDIESILNNKAEGCIYTGVNRGESYSDYLEGFTYLLNEEVKLLRMMDLVQMNLRYLYYDSFLLREYNGGLSVSIKVNGENHEAAKKY